MFRIILMAAVAALWSGTAVAKGPEAGLGGASRGGGSTGPTFPAPDPETLIAEGPAPTDVDVGRDGQPPPGSPGINPDTSSAVVAPFLSPRRTR